MGPYNELWDRVYWCVALEVAHAVSYLVGDTFAHEPARIVR